MQELSVPLERGATLGPFRILALLGSGGMGEVYRARDTKLGREVAIKILPRHLASSDRTRARFRREAKLLASLNHPNIATIHGLEESEGVQYLVLELVDGPSLSSVIAERGLDVEQALRIGREIAYALAAAHEAGVIHRDLKPANVMLTGRGQVKVLDFGLGKRLSLDEPDSDLSLELTQKGLLYGTPAYMSPERLKDREPDARADIWSFGCLLFEMLSGERPFDGPTPLATITAVLTADPGWDALPGGLPRGIDTLLVRCLEKDPDARLDSMADAMAAIDRISARTLGGTTTGLLSQAGAEGRPSIAVLPFADLSGRPESEYFGHGLAEELIHELGRIRGLRVAARTSSFLVGSGRHDIREIGRRLDVDAVLEGSVRISGDRIRVTVQLVDTAEGFQLWSQRFDRSSRDIFQIQDEIAEAIVDKLEVELAEPGDTPLVRRYTESLEAQKLFMKGRYYWAKRHEVGLATSMQLFEEAIAIDPEHVGAHVGLADAYWSIGGYAIRPPEEVFPKAEAAALRALRIDDRHPGAHMALAMVHFVFEWEWAAAEREFRRAIALNPHESSPHGYYSLLLGLLGRSEEALREADLCRSLDPLSAGAYGLAALSVGLLGRFDEAMQVCREGLDAAPEFFGDQWVMAWLLDRSGRHAESAELLEALTGHFGRKGMLLAMLGHALAASGDEEAARQVLSELATEASAGYVSPAFFAWVHQGLGESGEAQEWMERAFEQRSNPVLFAEYGGFGTFMQRAGLPP